MAARLDPTWAEPLIKRAERAPLRASIGLFAGGEGVPFAPDEEGRKELGRQALTLIEEALSRDPGNRDALYCRATLLLDWTSFFGELDPLAEEANLRRAEEDLQRAASGTTPHPESMGKLAILLARDRGDYLRAKRYGLEALDQDPWIETLDDVTRWLAIALFELGEDESALSWCAEPFQRSITHWSTAWMLAECQLMVMALGDLPNPSPDSAWALLQGTVLGTDSGPARSGPISRNDYRSRGLLMYAGVLAAARQPDSAEAVFGRLQTIEARKLSAGLLARMGKTQAGFDKLQEFLRNTPVRNPELILNSRALRYLRGYAPFDSLRAAGG